MHDIPHAVLSEQFQSLMRGKRLKTAVFLTFSFEPDFFEQEILPAVMPDLPLSHAPRVRALQLEDALKSSVDHVAVYYDRQALCPSNESAKLDAQRVPIAYPTGYFHPKNVFLLTESVVADESGHHQQHLIFATLSANLTRAGWWENVEACHIEEVSEGELWSLRDDVLDLIRRVRTAAQAATHHEALDTVRVFVKALQQRQQSTAKGVLHPRLYCGGESVADFLDRIAGKALRNLNLEIISPYFDAADPGPIRDLQERFQPREVRVYLPRDSDGSGVCNEKYYKAVREIANVSWAQLPAELLRSGKSEQAKPRRVHAKVYRFFHPTQRYEALFVGSVNLTTAAHSSGGNFESGFLVETDPKRVPDWWLIADSRKPSRFLGSETDEQVTARTSLSLRFDWSSRGAYAFWDARQKSPVLEISAQGVALFELPALPPREWQPLSRDSALALELKLSSTSLLHVASVNEPAALILVQEDGMAHKPSILHSLSPTEILHYWSLLTPEQRSAFLDAHADDLDRIAAGAPTVPMSRPGNSAFDTYAGIFHSFQMLERHVLTALREKRRKEAEYRLLGKKYDSLPTLLDRVIKQEGRRDVVTDYLIALCARQLLAGVEREFPDFRNDHRAAFRALKAQITRAERVKEQFTFGSRTQRTEFLAWFDEWFLRRATPNEARA